MNIKLTIGHPSQNTSIFNNCCHENTTSHNCIGLCYKNLIL